MWGSTLVQKRYVVVNRPVRPHLCEINNYLRLWVFIKLPKLLVKCIKVLVFLLYQRFSKLAPVYTLDFQGQTQDNE